MKERFYYATQTPMVEWARVLGGDGHYRYDGIPINDGNQVCIYCGNVIFQNERIAWDWRHSGAIEHGSVIDCKVKLASWKARFPADQNEKEKKSFVTNG